MDWREGLAKGMARRGVSRQALSLGMGVGAPQITRLLQADSNPTIETLERMANAAGLELAIEFRDVEALPEAPAPEAPPRPLSHAKAGKAKACAHGHVGAGCSACGA